MITLEELYKKQLEVEEEEKEKKELKKKSKKETKEKSKKEEKPIRENKWKPQEIKGLKTPPFNPPAQLTKSKKEKVSKWLAFVYMVQGIRLKSGCTAMPIPTTSKRYQKIWKNKMQVGREIQEMIKLGLIAEYDNSSRFGAKVQSENYSRIFTYFKENEDKLIQYCEDNNISPYDIYQDTEKEVKQKEKIIKKVEPIITFKTEEVRFSTNLKLRKPEGISNKQFEIFLKDCLYENYPEYRLTEIKIKEINDFYDEVPNFKLSFEPSYTWRKDKVIKIGIRVTNTLCNMDKKSERPEFLDKNGFYLEKDMSGSIARLTLSINKGHWIDETIDMYELMGKEFEPEVEWKESRRDMIKYYFYKSYFTHGSDIELGRNVSYKLYQKGIVKTEVDKLIGDFRKCVINVLGGKIYDNDIFYIESCVYIMTVYDLLKSGFMVWLLYDCFYAKKSKYLEDEETLDEETFKSMVEKGVALNLKYFMEHSRFKQECIELNGEDLWG